MQAAMSYEYVAVMCTWARAPARVCASSAGKVSTNDVGARRSNKDKTRAMNPSETDVNAKDGRAGYESKTKYHCDASRRWWGKHMTPSGAKMRRP